MSEDRTSLGQVLLALGMVTEEQLSEVQAAKDGDPDLLLGRLLVVGEVITEDELDTALSAQAGLRSSKRTRRAQGEAQIASHRMGRVITMASRLACVSKAAVEGMSAKRESGEFRSVWSLVRKAED